MTEQQPTGIEKIKNRLIIIWARLLDGFAHAGRLVKEFTRVFTKKTGAFSHRVKNKILPGIGRFFSKHIRRARTDMSQLVIKIRGPEKARAEKKQRLKNNDEFSESSRSVSASMKQKLSRVKTASVLSSLKRLRDKEQSDETDFDHSRSAEKNDHYLGKHTDNYDTLRFNTVSHVSAGVNQQTRRMDLKKALKSESTDQKYNSDQEISKDQSLDQAISTDQSLEEQIKPVLPAKLIKKKRKSPPIRRKSRQRVYRLVGYTTVAKVNRKHQAEMQQQFLRKFLVYAAVILLIVVLFKVYNPFRDLSELYRILGISDLSEFSQNSPLIPDATPTPGR